MKEKVKNESMKNSKRKISIITMFVGILLLFTIGVISLKGLNKTNALEETVNLSNINLEADNINLINNESDELLNVSSSVNGGVMYGEDIVHTITFKNIYDYDLNNITIEYYLTYGLEFISSYPESELDDYFRLKWDIPTIKANESITITVNTKVGTYKGGGALYIIVKALDDLGVEIKEVSNSEIYVIRSSEARIQVTNTPRKESYDVSETATWDIEITNNTRMEQEFIIKDELSNGKKAIVTYNNEVIPNNEIIKIPIGKINLVATYEIDKNDSESLLINTITLTNPYFDSYFNSSGMIRINKLKEKKNILVSKIWEDNKNEAGKRPENITLQIKDGDKIVDEYVVNEKNNWRHIFELEQYDEEENEINYTVDEKETYENYEKRIEGYTVINKYIDDEENDKESNKDKEEIENNINDINKNIENVDTSDINIWIYVGIAIISIIVIIVSIIIIKKNKSK